MPNKIARRLEPSISAILQAAQLVREHFEVIEQVAKDIPATPMQLSARSNISNEASLSFDDAGTATSLMIKCLLTVNLTLANNGKVLAKYESDYRAAFKIVSSSGVTRNMELSPALTVPYLSQVNWLAVRRADGSIAASGIANIRLQAPNVESALVVKQQAAGLADARRTRSKRSLKTRSK